MEHSRHHLNLVLCKFAQLLVRVRRCNDSESKTTIARPSSASSLHFLRHAPLQQGAALPLPRSAPQSPRPRISHGTTYTLNHVNRSHTNTRITLNDPSQLSIPHHHTQQIALTRPAHTRNQHQITSQHLTGGDGRICPQSLQSSVRAGYLRPPKSTDTQSHQQGLRLSASASLHLDTPECASSN